MAVVRSLAVVGTGLIGASVGLAARRAGVERVVGWDLDPAHLATAAERGAVEAAPDLAAALEGAELAVVAAPVTALPAQVRAVLDASAPDCTVTDVGSTKGGVCEAVTGVGQVRRRTSDLRLGGARAGVGDGRALRRRDVVSDSRRLDRPRQLQGAARLRLGARGGARRDRPRGARPPRRGHEPSAARAGERASEPGRRLPHRRPRAACGGGWLAARHDQGRRREPAHLGRHLPREPRGARRLARRAPAPRRAGRGGARRRRRRIPRAVDRRGLRRTGGGCSKRPTRTRASSSGCGCTCPTGRA